MRTCSKAGLRDTDIVMRMAGCPNGCSRPYLAECGLVGRAPGLYNVYLGVRSTARGSTKFYTQDIDHAEILTRIEPQIAQYANARNAGERFGDFVIRAEFVTATPAGNRFHENVVLAG